MDFYLEHIFAAVLYTECCAGIMVNMIILAAIILKWKTLRSLQPYYKILSCLVMSRSLDFLNILLFYIITVVYRLLDMVTLVTLRVAFFLLHYTNLWFVTVLCVFYCVKIMSYNCKVFTFLKTKPSTVIPWLLLASLIISVSSSFPIGFCVYYLEANNFTNSAKEIMVVYNDGLVIDLHKQLQIFILGSSPPFLIICVTTCLLLHSLWMHTRRMRSSGSGFRRPNLESHFSAVKNMSFFLVSQIIYFILMNVISSGRVHHNNAWVLFTSIITSSPSIFHSLYIIVSNTDLKKICISMFQALTRGAQC